ncbi:hypothetical protein R5R35_006667 [Gryllus longicercus]|uniref:Thyroglobulin type-1 domain-containing protein n=1 Tax=Gryllus longicercus TaxID=2509291 RepID=A0AAN9VU55_9ORTH
MRSAAEVEWPCLAVAVHSARGRVGACAACSVRAWRLTQEGRGAHEAPRCAADGSFEALQCARGVCWCADAKTGAPQGRVAPARAARQLFCYRAEAVGEGYRRRCDSQMEARARIVEVMEARGTTPYGLPYVNCDLDGSFAPVQLRDSGQRFCAWKDKQQILGFQQPATENNGMNCNCARDTVLLGNTLLRCSSNGNYETYRDEDGKIYCVDDDGYFMKFVDTITDSCVG